MLLSIQETYLNFKDRHFRRVKSWEKIYLSNTTKKQAGVTTIISNKIDFKEKVIKILRRTFHIHHRKKLIKVKSQY